MSLHRKVLLSRAPGLLAAAFVLVLPLHSQYPGQVAKPKKGAPELRSIAVLEWTGEAGHPKTSRLVPVAVVDQSQLEGDQIQDGGIYMARPQPLALAGEVEYELMQNGKPVGLFDIKNAGQEQGLWVGYGSWKPLPAPKSKPTAEQLAHTQIDDEASDQPVLHRKHHADEGGKPAGGGDSGSSNPAPAPDPDRPTLHKKDPGADAGSSGTSAPADDPDRPVLKKSKKQENADIGHVESLPDVTDPDRPRLKRGEPTGSGLDVLPTLMGMPANMEQMVAISDAKDRPEHPWSYSWANPGDEARMKSALEEIARDALGLHSPEPAAPARKTARKIAKPLAPPEPPPLLDERFHVFELAYGTGATLVLSAHTDGSLAQQRFVTLIAQPDLYGNVLVLLKNVTDGRHLDETPRMRLVDAVDALADNRGELLFELRGATQRQFALYRIYRGRADKLFSTAAGAFGVESQAQ